MFDEETLRQLSEWLHRNGGAEVARDLVPRSHPILTWLTDDGELARSDANVDELVTMLANGGHIALLVGIVLLTGTRTSTPLPSKLGVALGRALCVVDSDVTRLTSSAHSAAADIFVSYAHEDAIRVDRIVTLLRSAGVSVFRDTDTIQPGQSIAASVAGAATRAIGAMVVVSAAMHGSRWVKRELAWLTARRTAGAFAVFPVVLDDVALPTSVADVFAVDLRGMSADTPDDFIVGRLRPLIEQIRKLRPTCR